MYLKIAINDGQFTTSKTSEKHQQHGLAFATLSLIEQILKNQTSDPLTLQQLQNGAHKIRDRYLEKTSKLSWLRRFFGGVTKQEQKIIQLCRNIDTIAQRHIDPQFMFSALDVDLGEYIAEFLSVRDLQSLRATCTDGREQSDKVIVAQAKTFGYQGDDATAANLFLQEHFRKLCEAANTVVVRTSQSCIDVQATLPKLLLHYAKKADAQSVQFLIDYGADVNALTDEEGDDALHLAIKSDQTQEKIIDTATVLLEKGASLGNLVETRCPSPLRLAVQLGKPMVVSFLLQRGANVHLISSDRGFTVLEEAMECAYYKQGESEAILKIVRILLEAGANPNQAREGRDPPLHWAAKRKQPNIVKLLLEHGAKHNFLRPGHYAPLQYALSTPGNSAATTVIVQALLDAKADPNQTNPEGSPPPLQLAVNNQYYSAIVALVQAGATVPYIS